MARKIFFSFHYERDIWRAMQVRNSDQISDKDEVGFIDKADFEKLQRQGEAAVHRWINAQLVGTSVTVVLIGAETASRPYVQYEIEQSWSKGNGLLGVYIHGVKDAAGKTDVKGSNPFAGKRFELSDGTVVPIQTYDWVRDDGRENMASWIEDAAEAVGR
jgi:hypothetical protein